MRDGYSIVWTDRALTNLDNIMEYLEKEWTQKETTQFFRKLENRIHLLSQRPLLYPLTKSRKNVRRSVLTSHITIYYRVKKDTVEILTLFNSRRNPDKLAL